MTVSSITPHLVSLFGAIGNLLTDPSHTQSITTIIAVESVEGERLNLISSVSKGYVCATNFVKANEVEKLKKIVLIIYSIHMI